MKNKIGPDMLSRRISKQDIQNAKRRTKLLEYLGIIEYYDQSETVYISEYIPTRYKSIEAYESDKFTARMLIDSNKPIPKELEQKLVIAKQELERYGVLESLQK